MLRRRARTHDAALTQPLLTRSFGLLVIAHFLQALAYASMLLLPLYAGHLGASRTEIGLIMAVASVGGLSLRPVAGWALDTVGRRPTLLVATLILAVGMVMLAGVDRIGPLIYGSRVLIGVGVGTLFTAYFAFAADIIPPARRTEGIALFGISGLLPLAVNPLAGQLTDPAQLRWLYPALAVVILFSIPAFMSIPEPSRAARRETVRPPVRPALMHRRLLPVWFATTIFAALVTGFFTFATVAASGRGVDNPASLWLTYAGGAVAVRLLGAHLPDRLGPTNLVAPALALYVLAYVLAAGAQDDATFQLAGLLAGLGHGYCFPVLTGQTVSRAPEALRGSALAMFTATWELSGLAIRPLLGAIADRHDDATMFAATALIAVLGLAVWALWEHLIARRTDPS